MANELPLERRPESPDMQRDTVLVINSAEHMACSTQRDYLVTAGLRCVLSSSTPAFTHRSPPVL
jgi:hypothetical protein